MVELVDASDSKSEASNGVRVRFPLPAYKNGMYYKVHPVFIYHKGIERLRTPTEQKGRADRMSAAVSRLAF